MVFSFITLISSSGTSTKSEVAIKKIHTPAIITSTDMTGFSANGSTQISIITWNTHYYRTINITSTFSSKGLAVWSTSKIYWLRSGWQHIYESTRVTSSKYWTNRNISIDRNARSNIIYKVFSVTVVIVTAVLFPVLPYIKFFSKPQGTGKLKKNPNPSPPKQWTDTISGHWATRVSLRAGYQVNR